jgi:prepilin-type N-terminal cleavage/methylation domain-containing protein
MKLPSSPQHENAPRRSTGGFTLLEIVIALSVFVIIIAGVFAIAKGTMELSEDLASTQERAMARQNFIEFMRNSFRRLPGDGEITLDVENQRGTYVPTISVFNGGDAFSPGPSLPPDGSVELFAQEMPGGYLRIGLRIIDDVQTNANRIGLRKKRAPSKDDLVLPLIERVMRCEFRFFDAATQQWVTAWKGPGRPLFAEMQLSLDDGAVTRQVFWIPPIQKPSPDGSPAILGPDGKPLPPGSTPPPGTVAPPNPQLVQ